MNEIEREILKIHELFQAWYNGTIEQNSLVEIESKLSDSFYIVFPDATKNSKNDLTRMMEKDYGNDTSYRIEIKEIKVNLLTESVYLASYQEWQFWDNEEEPQLKLQTTAVLREDNNMVEWMAIHETGVK